MKWNTSLLIFTKHTLSFLEDSLFMCLASLYLIFNMFLLVSIFLFFNISFHIFYCSYLYLYSCYALSGCFYSLYFLNIYSRKVIEYHICALLPTT